MIFFSIAKIELACLFLKNNFLKVINSATFLQRKQAPLFSPVVLCESTQSVAQKEHPCIFGLSLDKEFCCNYCLQCNNQRFFLSYFTEPNPYPVQFSMKIKMVVRFPPIIIE